jgi:hypothetical protein
MFIEDVGMSTDFQEVHLFNCKQFKCILVTELFLNCHSLQVWEELFVNLFHIELTGQLDVGRLQLRLLR